MANSDNSPKIPEFMSKEFFKRALQNGLGLDNIEIEDIKTSIASVVGENYTSVIYRTQIKYHETNKVTQEISLIVKSMIMADFMNQIMESIQAFPKETMMYKEIIPGIEKLYKSIETFAPKCFYVENEPTHQVIVLQDLQASGYALADRVKRLDEEHTKILLRKLGRYHAGTIVLYQKEPDVFKFFDKGFYDPEIFNMLPFQQIFNESIEQFTEYVSEWKGFEVIVEKLKNVQKNLKEKVFEYLSSKPNEIRVLNHSDVWTNNIMYTYDNGKVSDLNFIDFQGCTNGSLGMDINYFLITSVDFDLLENKRDELLKHYYDALVDGLKELNYSKIPSWHDVQNEIKSKEFFGFMIAIGNLPIIILDREFSKEMTNDIAIEMQTLSKKRSIVYSTERYQKFMKYSLKRYDELGIFD